MKIFTVRDETGILRIDKLVSGSALAVARAGYKAHPASRWVFLRLYFRIEGAAPDFFRATQASANVCYLPRARIFRFCQVLCFTPTVLALVAELEALQAGVNYMNTDTPAALRKLLSAASELWH